MNADFGTKGLIISIFIDKKYELAHVYDPRSYHMIVISYYNDILWVRVDDNIYKSFLIKEEKKLDNILSLNADNSEGEFKDL